MFRERLDQPNGTCACCARYVCEPGCPQYQGDEDPVKYWREKTRKGCASALIVAGMVLLAVGLFILYVTR